MFILIIRTQLLHGILMRFAIEVGSISDPFWLKCSRLLAIDFVMFLLHGIFQTLHQNWLPKLNARATNWSGYFRYSFWASIAFDFDSIFARAPGWSGYFWHFVWASIAFDFDSIFDPFQHFLFSLCFPWICMYFYRLGHKRSQSNSQLGPGSSPARAQLEPACACVPLGFVTVYFYVHIGVSIVKLRIFHLSIAFIHTKNKHTHTLLHHNDNINFALLPYIFPSPT